MADETTYDVGYKEGYKTGYQDGFKCAKFAHAPTDSQPQAAADVVLVSREEAAKVAEAEADSWRQYINDEDGEAARVARQACRMVANRLRALPPYTKEHVDG